MTEETNKVGVPFGRSLTDEEYRIAILEAKKTAKKTAIEPDYSTPMLAFIDTLDEDVSFLFQNRIEEIDLELKKDGTFNAKTIQKINNLVDELTEDEDLEVELDDEDDEEEIK